MKQSKREPFGSSHGPKKEEPRRIGFVGTKNPQQTGKKRIKKKGEAVIGHGPSLYWD